MKSVAPGGPAAIAGVLEGDLVVQYGRTPISDVATLIRLAAANSPGDSVPIRVRRGTTEQTLRVVVDRATSPAMAATVLIYYAADDDQKAAEDLATDLRESMNEHQYLVRTLKTSRAIGSEGEVLYSSPGLSRLAGTLARSAGSWLSRTYGRRVAFTPTVEPRVAARDRKSVV